jgi:MbtH protein
MDNDVVDVESSNYLVVANEAGEHSLWSDFAEVPPGWHVVHGPAVRAAALEYFERHITDKRIKGMRDRTTASRRVLTAPSF